MEKKYSHYSLTKYMYCTLMSSKLIFIQFFLGCLIDCTIRFLFFKMEQYTCSRPLVRCHWNGCQNLYIIIIILCETKLSLAYIIYYWFSCLLNTLLSTYFFLIIVVKTSVEADDRNPSKLRATMMMIPRPDSIMSSLTAADYCKFHNGLLNFEDIAKN